MKSHIASIGVALAIVAGLGVNGVFAQQAPVKRDFETEIRAALESAKTAAGFEFLGTLVRTCLLPQSGGEDTRDNVPGYITNPTSAPARNTWYAEPAKVFDNLYFVGGKLHSAWALTTKDGISLIDTIYPYNSEALIIGGMQKIGLDPKNIKYVLISHAHGDHIGAPRCCKLGTGPESSWVGPIGIRLRSIRTATRQWRRNATS
jgi:metallo-beta-lactamase class B